LLLGICDPDGDPISLRLENAPARMEMAAINPDKTFFEIEWQTTYARAGNYTVKVIAEDNGGGFSSQDVTFTAYDIPSP